MNRTDYLVNLTKGSNFTVEARNAVLVNDYFWFMFGRMIQQKYILGSVILLFSFLGLGQSKSESGKKQKTISKKAPASSFKYKEENVTVDIDQNLKKAQSIYRESSEKAIEYVQEALVESKVNGDNLSIAKCYELLGVINQYHKQDILAEKNYEKSGEYYLLAKSTSKYIESLVSLAQVQLNQNKNKLVQQNANKVINHKSSSVLNRLMANELLGEVAYREKKYDNAIRYFTKQQELEGTKSRVKLPIRSGANLAKVYAAKEEIEKAEGLLKESYNTSKKEVYFDVVEETDEISFEATDSEVPDLSSPTQNSLSDKRVIQEKVLENYRQGGFLDKEIQVRKDLLENEDLKENKPALQSNKVQLGEAYLEKGDYEEAIEVLQETKDYAWQKDELSTQAKSVKLLSEALSKSGKNTEALLEYEKYVKLQDDLLAQKEKEILLSSKMASQQSKTEAIEKDYDLFTSETRYNNQKKETVQAQLRTQKLINYGLFFLLFLTSIGAFFIYKNSKAKRKANQLLALKSLRSQMNPHFIFNALNSVNSFISKNDERSANKFLTDFSKLMRMVLESSHEDIISLHQEVNVIDLYLKLEQYRFRDKFDYDLSISNDIDKDTFMIPPMLIQPFIENAVWHGLRYKEEFGKLRVNIDQQDEKIVVTVEDDGIGRVRSAGLKTKNQKTTKSRGLQNTKERISVINDLYSTSLKLEVTDLIPDALDKGTKVKLTIPQIG